MTAGVTGPIHIDEPNNIREGIVTNDGGHILGAVVSTRLGVQDKIILRVHQYGLLHGESDRQVEPKECGFAWKYQT